MLVPKLRFIAVELAFVVPPLCGKLTRKNRPKPELQTVFYRSTLLYGSDEESGNDVKLSTYLVFRQYVPNFIRGYVLLFRF